MIEQKIDELIASIDRLTQAVTNHTTAAHGSDYVLQAKGAVGKVVELTPVKWESTNPAETPAGAAAEAAVTEAPKKTKGKKVAAPAAEKVESTPAPEPVAETVTPEVVEEKKAEPDISIKDLREVAQRLVDKGQVLKIKAINTKFGIAKISAAAPEQFADILKALNAELAALETASV